MKVLRILGGVICLSATALMIFGFFQQLFNPSMSPKILAHDFGMLLIAMTFLGCAGVYGFFGFWLFSQKSELKLTVFGLVSLFAMMIGLYGCVFVASF